MHHISSAAAFKLGFRRFYISPGLPTRWIIGSVCPSPKGNWKGQVSKQQVKGEGRSYIMIRTNVSARSGSFQHFIASYFVGWYPGEDVDPWIEAGSPVSNLELGPSIYHRIIISAHMKWRGSVNAKEVLTLELFE